MDKKVHPLSQQTITRATVKYCHDKWGNTYDKPWEILCMVRSTWFLHLKKIRENGGEVMDVITRDKPAPQQELVIRALADEPNVPCLSHALKATRDLIFELDGPQDDQDWMDWAAEERPPHKVPSKSTTCSAMNRRGDTRKRGSRVTRANNPEVARERYRKARVYLKMRKRWARRGLEEIHVDEVTIDRGKAAGSTYGYAPKGERYTPFNRTNMRGPSVNLVVFMGKSGYKYVEAVTRITQETFGEVLQNALHDMRHHNIRPVLVMDNHTSHSVENLEWIDEITPGGEYFLLPPHAPLMNASELLFNWIKSFISQHDYEMDHMTALQWNAWAIEKIMSYTAHRSAFNHVKGLCTQYRSHRGYSDGRALNAARKCGHL